MRKGRKRKLKAATTHGMRPSECHVQSPQILGRSVFQRQCVIFFLFVLSSVSSRGQQMPRLHPRALEPQTAARNLATLLPPVPTTAQNPLPASQVGPRREAAAGAAREHHQTTRYTYNSKDLFLVRRSMLVCRKVEKPKLHVGQLRLCD